MKPAADARLTSSTVTFSAVVRRRQGGTGIAAGGSAHLRRRRRADEVGDRDQLLDRAQAHRRAQRYSPLGAARRRPLRQRHPAHPHLHGSGAHPDGHTDLRPAVHAAELVGHATRRRDRRRRRRSTRRRHPRRQHRRATTWPAVPYGDAVSGTPVLPGRRVRGPSTVSASPLGGEGGGGRRHIGGALLVALPIGAALSYLAMRRNATQMAVAGTGKTLAGGGTPWQRFSTRLGAAGSAGGAAWHRFTSRFSRARARERADPPRRTREYERADRRDPRSRHPGVDLQRRRDPAVPGADRRARVPRLGVRRARLALLRDSTCASATAISRRSRSARCAPGRRSSRASRARPTATSRRRATRWSWRASSST